MSKPLYLDTARLGLMTPRARRASVEFARFASELGCSLYSTDFLKSGFQSWPVGIQARYPGLSDWDGVSTLKDRLRSVAAARSDCEVVVASRSASLMKIAARLLFQQCQRVMVTDLTWPSYGRHLRRQQRRTTGQIHTLRLRKTLYACQPSADEVIEQVTIAYRQSQCDGLFLPLVDSFGGKRPANSMLFGFVG